MGKQRKLWLAVLLAAALGGGVWLMMRPPAPEPVYEGKPLSYWLEGYQANGKSNIKRQKTDAAVRQTGTNAIPVLLRMLRARDSSLTLKLVALAQRQNLIVVHFIPATEHNSQAGFAFVILSVDASNAVPALIKILEEKRSLQSEAYTMFSLAQIGPAAAAAVPALLQSATNPASILRNGSLYTLGYIRAEPERVVPALIRGLSDPDRNVRGSAIDALGSFGQAAKPAVPALIAAAGVTQTNRRDSVIKALKKIDPAAAEALENEK